MKTLISLLCLAAGLAAGTGIASAASTGWTAYSQTPVIQAGDFRHQALWNDPSVIKAGKNYVMYMTTSTNAPFQPPVLPFRAVSADGIHWKLSPDTPLLTTAGTPFASLETPSVVRLGGLYHMFFTGIYAAGQSAPMAIGHAQSADGVHWAATPQPVLQATGRPADWNGYAVGEPGAVVYKGKIYVYFTATAARQSGAPPQEQSIGLATTADGVHFSAPQRVLQQTDHWAATRGYAGYSTPAAYVQDGKVNLMYDVAHYKQGGNPEWQQVALEHAVSASDGTKDFVEDDKPVFTRADFSWTSGEILAPAALLEGSSVKLWFAGHVKNDDLAPLIRNDFVGPQFGIGYAVKP